MLDSSKRGSRNVEILLARSGVGSPVVEEQGEMAEGATIEEEP